LAPLCTDADINLAHTPSPSPAYHLRLGDIDQEARDDEKGNDHGEEVGLVHHASLGADHLELAVAIDGMEFEISCPLMRLAITQQFGCQCRASIAS